MLFTRPTISIVLDRLARTCLRHVGLDAIYSHGPEMAGNYARGRFVRIQGVTSMGRLIIASLILSTGLTAAYGQSKADRKEVQDLVRDQRDSIVKEHRLVGLLAKGGFGSEAPSPLDVGEPDSFGKNAKFMGTVTAGIVYLDNDCAPITLGPDDRCIVVDPATPLPLTTFNDIGRITIPGKAVDNVLYSIANHTVNAIFTNGGPATVQGRLGYVPSITIESEALNNPALIDPTTGLPFNGSFTTTGLGTLTETRTVAPGPSEVMTNSYTRANTTGFSRTFFAALGLPDNVVNQIYKKPMTLKLNVRVSGQRLSGGVITYSIRFLGN